MFLKKAILFSIGFSLLVNVTLNAQEIKQTNKQNIILITIDGFRWQELFSGADKKLITNEKYVLHPDKLKEKYWRNTASKRREALMPFVWSQVKTFGQIHGNRTLGSKVNVTNKHHFSYPGYSEILTGIADDTRIKSNDKLPNPNVTILEYANKDKNYKGKVVAFGSWDVFPSIINESRSGVSVNAGFESVRGDNLNSHELFLNKLQKETFSPWDNVRLDVFTHNYALENMQKNHPKFLYIAYGETDDFAHYGRYGYYLDSAHTTDKFIKEIWDYVQSDKFYKDNTTLIITTDHGRGSEPLDTWKDHSASIKGCDEVWFIALGKRIKALGEASKDEQYYSNQIAASIAKILDITIDEQKMGQALEIIEK